MEFAPRLGFAQQQQALMAGTKPAISAFGDESVNTLLDRARQQFAAIPSVFNRPKEGPSAQASAPQASDFQWGEGNTPTGGRNNINDEYATAGFASNVPRSLIKTESGGNWAADNGMGYHGILQFGEARLADARKAGVIPADMTLQAFGSDTPQGRAAQIATANWHFSDIDRRIAAAGFDKMLGQNIGGTPITMDGMRAMAHLGGFGGLSRFLKSGGLSNPADAFGTSLASYAATHQN